jgi:hypothetical protein
MTILISQIEYDEVAPTPAGQTWESALIPAGKRVLLREFGASVGNGTVILKLGPKVIRVVVDGTVEFNTPRDLISVGGKLSIQRINNSGSPRIIAAWIDALVED